VVFNTGPYTVLPENSILITANMQSEMGFPSSHQLKSYVAYKSHLKLAARDVLSADAGLLVTDWIPTCHPTNSVKALNGIQSNDSRHPLASSVLDPLPDSGVVPSRQHSNASNESINFITGRIRAKQWYLSYSEVDFQVFRPAEATSFTEFPSSVPNFTPIGATVRV